MEIQTIEASYLKHRNTKNRDHDWCATLDSYDGAADTPFGIHTAVGHGETELLAISDLMQSLMSYDDGKLFIDLMAIGLDGETSPDRYYDLTLLEIEKNKIEAHECQAEDTMPRIARPTDGE